MKADNDDDEEEPQRKRRRRIGSPEIGEDGYKVHSDDEADWSDVADDIYGQPIKKKATISRKEANRRRQWAADDDAATAAGRAWPALPRTEVSKVLNFLLEEVLKHDEARGGIFSVPVPREEFPEYYELIKNPMDYGTMKKKLDNGEYRSAQSMQKDFVLVMQNCLKFNAADSEIVQEARQQALMRPHLLRTAAMKHDLFLAEDGSVLHVVDDKDATKGRKRTRRGSADGEETFEEALEALKSKKKKGKKGPRVEEIMELGVDDDDVPLTSMKKKKPRIKINLREAKNAAKKVQEGMPAEIVDDNAEVAEEDTAVSADRKRKPRKSSTGTKKPTPAKRKGKTRAARKEEEDDADEFPETRRTPGRPRTARKSSGSNGTIDNGGAEYLDVPLLKKEREEMSDSSFNSARTLFTKRGPWVLPDPLESDKFKDVATITIKKIEKIDRYSVFSELVSDDDAPDYSKIVKKPIALSTIKSKVEKGKYGEGKNPAARFFKDILLMFDNCRLYNDDDGEVIDEAARIFALVPELYGEACASILKKQQKK
jgi:hypothetical protein